MRRRLPTRVATARRYSLPPSASCSVHISDSIRVDVSSSQTASPSGRNSSKIGNWPPRSNSRALSLGGPKSAHQFGSCPIGRNCPFETSSKTATSSAAGRSLSTDASSFIGGRVVILRQDEGGERVKRLFHVLPRFRASLDYRPTPSGEFFPGRISNLPIGAF